MAMQLTPQPVIQIAFAIWPPGCCAADRSRWADENSARSKGGQLWQMGGGNGSNPQVSASASVAVTSDFQLFSGVGSSGRTPVKEVQIKNDQFARNRSFSVGIVANVRVKILYVVAAAFLVLRCGEGLPPSA